MAPLPAAEPVPHLASELIPDAFRPSVVDVTERTCCSPEFVAIPTMIAAGAVVGRQIGIKPTRFDDFVAVCVSVCGSIQPGKLKHYISDAIAENEGADGLLQRLQLLVWPDDLGEWQTPTRFADTEAKNRTYQIFEILDDVSALNSSPSIQQGYPSDKVLRGCPGYC